MHRGLFPERIETDRLTLERLCHDRVDPFERYAFVTRDDWRAATEEHMPSASSGSTSTHSSRPPRPGTSRAVG